MALKDRHKVAHQRRPPTCCAQPSRSRPQDPRSRSRKGVHVCCCVRKTVPMPTSARNAISRVVASSHPLEMNKSQAADDRCAAYDRQRRPGCVAPLGIEAIDTPLTPPRVWQAIQSARYRPGRHDVAHISERTSRQPRTMFFISERRPSRKQRRLWTTSGSTCCG